MTYGTPRPGGELWLHFWGHEGDAEFARSVWERIQTVMKLDDKTFTAADWHALVAIAQSREIGSAVAYCLASDREKMSIEASEETERLQRFIP